MPCLKTKALDFLSQFKEEKIVGNIAYDIVLYLRVYWAVA